ncbi:MAG TPA: VWA domain-containing protein [Vicinamibacterales bacterium]|nr:VWA domain-containing protein [Vicinamibacterales bacterium]
MKPVARRFAWLTLGLATVALAQVASRAQQAQPQAQTDQPPAQPVFRAGINYVRVDVIVSDKNGANIADLKQTDFEVLEDGKPQTVENFKFIKLDGGSIPTEDGPPRPIRNDDDEEREAARDDVRLFAIFLDDYHVRKENSLRVRQPIQQFVQTQLGPSDMIGLMYPLESIFSVRMTRNHNAVVAGIDKFLGRKYDYTPMNDLERQYTWYPAETQEQIRVRVSLSAIRGLIVHMGTLKEGRKSLVIVSEGFSNRLPSGITPIGAAPTGTITGREGIVDPVGLAGLSGGQADFAAAIDMEQLLRDVYDEANKNNVSLYTVDPRGLAVSEFDVSDGSVNPTTDRTFLNSTMDTLRTLAVETDGKAIVNRNDLAGGMKQIVRDVSAYYLIGYNSMQAPADGKFHEIKVRVKRPGVQVRARRGYWALTPEEKAMSTRSPKAPVPAAVTAALSNVSNSSVASRSRSIRTWIGTSRGENGKTRVTLVWEPMPRRPGDPPLSDSQQPARVSVTAVGNEGAPYFRGRVPDAALASRSPSPSDAGNAARGPSQVTFDAPPGTMQLRLSVEGVSAGVIDSELRDVVVPDLTKATTSLGTPAVFRARTPRELQQMKADLKAIPATTREFSRTDRVFVRVPVYGAGAPSLSVHLLNRTGQPMSEVPATAPASPDADSMIDVPLSGLAPGEYLLEIKANGEGGEAKELVGFRVTS